MPLLKALVHVSTAYSNAPRSYIEEQVYQPPCDPDTILRCTTTLPRDMLENISEALQGEHPNPYTLTKALAESIVHRHTDLPVCIVRPSIVTAALAEPVPGWIDNVYGVTGIVMEISRGTYRSGLCRERLRVDLVPVDTLVNCCILAAWRQATKKPGHCPVYNVTSGSIAPLQWGHFTRLCVKWARENPTKYVMWYPNFSFTESRLLNTFWELSCHFLPAFLYDLLLRAQGRKPIMMKLARRFKMAAATGEYFANHEWQWGVGELRALGAAAESARDGHVFPAWPAEFSWESYIGAYMLGIRQFILKDPADSLPHARTKLKRLYWVHKLFQAATGYYLFRLLAGRLR
ncbi:putative fatty acyl-CoA reductase CG5065 [Leptidea sinapis]|uniref:putative fatty acyl-CoA reductase CG5065 n=1 Tax=Leptidea sinapis TaxID=189913 RepID=UPI0021349770|nr:putative fatty acyl-CoA reductase CG5065 [Leptidea sinapis]